LQELLESSQTLHLKCQGLEVAWGLKALTDRDELDDPDSETGTASRKKLVLIWDTYQLWDDKNDVTQASYIPPDLFQTVKSLVEMQKSIETGVHIGGGKKAAQAVKGGSKGGSKGKGPSHRTLDSLPKPAPAKAGGQPKVKVSEPARAKQKAVAKSKNKTKEPEVKDKEDEDEEDEEDEEEDAEEKIENEADDPPSKRRRGRPQTRQKGAKTKKA